MHEKGSFKWTKVTQSAFEVIKERLYLVPLLALPNFEFLFKVEYDAGEVGIGVVLTQSERHPAYFSEKLSRPRHNYWHGILKHMSGKENVIVNSL